jgi:hypothetical protein
LPKIVGALLEYGSNLAKTGESHKTHQKIIKSVVRNGDYHHRVLGVFGQNKMCGYSTMKIHIFGNVQLPQEGICLGYS